MKDILIPGAYPSLYTPHRVKTISISLLVLCALLVHWPVFTHQFLYQWDDQWVAINTYTDDGFASRNVWKVLTDFYTGQYAPVNEFYYIILHAAFGYNPFWFHAAGLLIHIGNVVLLYFFIGRLLDQARGFSPASIQRISFFTALLLAVHPFLVESIAWVSASKIILYVFFYLIALIYYLKYTVSSKSGYFWATLVAFIFSFGAKEQAVTMPVCLLLLDYVLGRDLRSRKVWMEKLPFFALSVFFGIVTILSQADEGMGLLSDMKTYPFHQNIFFASYSLLEYFFKCVLPVNLYYVYPFPMPEGDPLPLRFWIYPFALAVIVISLWSFWKQKWVFFGVSFFIIHLAIALHLIPMARYAIIADRYVYLSSVGVFFLMAYLFDKAIEKGGPYLRVLMLGGLLYVFSLGVYAHERSKAWHDSVTLKKQFMELLQKRSDYKEETKKYLRH